MISDNPAVIRPVLEATRKAFRSGRTRDISFRIAQLKSLKRGMKELAPKFDAAVEKDLKLSSFMHYYSTLCMCNGEIDDCIRHIRKWTNSVSVDTPLPLGPARSSIVPEPLGVCLIMSAWNFPLVTLIPPLATAITAGNCVIAKPSEMAPASSAVVKELFDKYLDKDCYRVIEGQTEVAKAITREKFDVIVFTGSPEKGRLVAKAAAENLVPCVLELGGKSPTVVDRDANLDNAAMRIVQGRFINAGQACISPDYCFVHKEVKEQFLNKLKEYKTKFFGEDASKDKDYARIVNKFHTERLKGYLDENHGGKVVFGGEVRVDDKYVAPTVVDSPNVDSKMMQDEIFGPILPVLDFDDFDKVIDFINDREKPLALYYYGSNFSKNKNRLIKETSSGAIMINDSIFHIANSNLPFGGVGNSGYGYCHGKLGFDNLTHMKPVMEKYSINAFPFNARYPPFNSSRQMILKQLLSTVSISQADVLRFILLLIFIGAVVYNWGLISGTYFGTSKGEL